MPSPPRLTAPAQFRLAYREGIRVADDVLVVYVRPAGTGPARMGITVRKAFGGAVQRNRVKRRLREAAARTWAALPPAADVVIVPRARAARAPFEELVGSLTELFTRARSAGRP